MRDPAKCHRMSMDASIHKEETEIRNKLEDLIRPMFL